MLASRPTSDVRNRLAALIERADDGTFAEPDAAVRQAAAVALSSIDTMCSFYSAIETLFFGLSLGSVLVSIAIGLAITFGVMGVINMAHGELMMLGVDHVRLAALDAAVDRALIRGGDSRGVSGCGRRVDLSGRLSVSSMAGRSSRRRPYFRHQPGPPAASCAAHSRREPRGRDAGMDERHPADHRGAGATDNWVDIGAAFTVVVFGASPACPET